MHYYRFLSILSNLCQFLRILSVIYVCFQFLFISVNSCQFLSAPVNSCHFLSILINHGHPILLNITLCYVLSTSYVPVIFCYSLHGAQTLKAMIEFAAFLYLIPYTVRFKSMSPRYNIRMY